LLRIEIGRVSVPKFRCARCAGEPVDHAALVVPPAAAPVEPSAFVPLRAVVVPFDPKKRQANDA
jgi:hypothetical protein